MKMTLIKLSIIICIVIACETAKSQSQIGDSLIGQIVATDKDAGQTLTYEIVSGNENNIFYVDKNTGLLYWHNKPETNIFRSYVLVIKVTDNGNPPLSSMANCTVNVIPTFKLPLEK